VNEMEDKHIKVLMIEDNPRDARLIREMLSEVRGALFDLKCADQPVSYTHLTLPTKA